MGIKEDLIKLKKQISRKKIEKEKIEKQELDLKNKKEKVIQELEDLENKYVRESLKYNDMTFEDFINLISNQE